MKYEDNEVKPKKERKKERNFMKYEDNEVKLKKERKKERKKFYEI